MALADFATSRGRGGGTIGPAPFVVTATIAVSLCSSLIWD